MIGEGKLTLVLYNLVAMVIYLSYFFSKYLEGIHISEQSLSIHHQYRYIAPACMRRCLVYQKASK